MDTSQGQSSHGCAHTFSGRHWDRVLCQILCVCNNSKTLDDLAMIKLCAQVNNNNDLYLVLCVFIQSVNTNMIIKTYSQRRLRRYASQCVVVEVLDATAIYECSQTAVLLFLSRVTKPM